MTKLGWIFGPRTCALFDVRQALSYGSGPIVRRVECAPPTPACKCPIRRVRWGYNAALVLKHLTRGAALDMVHLWDAPPIVLRYLKTGDESIRAAAHTNVTSFNWTSANQGAVWAAADATAPDDAWYAATAGILGAVAKALTSAAATDKATKTVIERRQSRRLAKMLTAGRRLYGQKAVP